MKNYLIALSVVILLLNGFATKTIKANPMIGVDEPESIVDVDLETSNQTISNIAQKINLVLIGIVVDKKTLLPVEGIRVEIMESNSNSNQWFITKQDGNFYFKLESDKEYSLSAINKNGRREDNKVISTDNKRKSEIMRSVIQITVPEVKIEPVIADFKIEKSNPTASANYNLVFKIQLGAFRQPISTKSTFYSNVAKDFTIETENTASGYIRYLVGNYTDISKAREVESTLQQKGYTKALIVPYLNNQRHNIPVEDAWQKYGSK